MFPRKTPKSQAPDHVPYVIYHGTVGDQGKPGEMCHVISIDPATKNYAIRMEKRYGNTFIPLLFEKWTLDDEVTNNVNSVFTQLTSLLDKHIEIIQQCNVVIIERQLPVNYRAVRISQHTLTYFLTRLQNKNALIVEVDSKLKGKELGAPKGLKDKQLKVWSTERASQILNYRGDQESIRILAKNKKKDDLSDTVCQIEGLFKHLKWNITEDKLVVSPNVQEKGKGKEKEQSVDQRDTEKEVKPKRIRKKKEPKEVKTE